MKYRKYVKNDHSDGGSQTTELLPSWCGPTSTCDAFITGIGRFLMWSYSVVSNH